jgi:hypothetical protein
MIRTTPGFEIDLRTATSVAELLMREGLDGDVEETVRWAAARVDRSTPEGLLIRLARLAHRLAVTAPFAELALARPDLDPALQAELQRLSGLSA